MLLSHVVSSKVDPNYLYVISQEGHPIQLDRRFNCRVVRKMPGAKGSVRDCKLISDKDHELVVTVGCDRHVRVFDPRQQFQKETSCGAAYLKQKLNCILFS